MTATLHVTATDQVTGHAATATAPFTVAAAFPSVLACSGRNLVDASGHVMPFLPGFCVPVYQTAAPFAAADFAAMYAKGARIARVMVYWDQLEPARGAIAAGWVASHLDVTVHAAIAQGLYVWLGFYFGPEGKHMPAWAQTSPGLPASCMSNYIANGQNATTCLAQRYGGTAGVIGMGINEPTPDYQNKPDWVARIVTQQAQMADWMRVYAPAWILSLSFGFGSTAPIPNAPGSGQTAQAFLPAPKAPAVNFWADHHNYFWNTDNPADPDWDGRNLDGSRGPHDLQRQDSPTYPPTAGGVTLTAAQLARMNAAYLAPYVAYCSPGYANCPLVIGEYGWDPKLNGTAGIAQNAADKLAAWRAAGAVSFTQWDYAVNQAADPMAARPGPGKPGAGPDGWQAWTDTMFASF